MADIKIYGTLKNVTNEPIARAEQIGDLSTVATSGSYNDLNDKPTIPTSISQLSEDSEHRTITDKEQIDYTYAAEQFKEQQITDYKSKIGDWNNTSITIPHDGELIFENYIIHNNASIGGSNIKAVLTRNNETITLYDEYVPPLETQTLNKIFEVLEGDVINFTNGLVTYSFGSDRIVYLKYFDYKILPTKTSELTNDSNFLTEHQDISGKQDVLVSGTNIKTINNISVLGKGNLNVVTGVKINNVTKTPTNGTVDLGTVLTSTTSSATSGSTTPITSGGVYTALQKYEKKMSFTSVSSLPSTCVVNTYYRITSSKTSLAITLPSSSLTAGDTIGISFTAGSSITTPTVSGGTIYKQDGWSNFFEANATYEIVALYDGGKWLVTSTKFNS